MRSPCPSLTRRRSGVLVVDVLGSSAERPNQMTAAHEPPTQSVRNATPKPTPQTCRSSRRLGCPTGVSRWGVRWGLPGVPCRGCAWGTRWGGRGVPDWVSYRGVRAAPFWGPLHHPTTPRLTHPSAHPSSPPWGGLAWGQRFAPPRHPSPCPCRGSAGHGPTPQRSAPEPPALDGTAPPARLLPRRGRPASPVGRTRLTGDSRPAHRPPRSSLSVPVHGPIVGCRMSHATPAENPHWVTHARARPRVRVGPGPCQVRRPRMRQPCDTRATTRAVITGPTAPPHLRRRHATRHPSFGENPRFGSRVAPQ